MKTLLIYPPQAQIFLPPASTPILLSALRRNNIDADQIDLNLEAYEHFLSSAILESAGISSENAAEIPQVLESLRTGGGYDDLPAYYTSLAILEDCLKAVSRLYHNAFLSLKTFSLYDYSTTDSRDIIEAASDRKANPFISFFESAIRKFQDSPPDFIGISISWTSQLIPAFTLAKVIKENLPDTRICLGGSLISLLAEHIKLCPALFKWVDFILPFEAEETLPQLIRILENPSPETSFRTIPGLIFSDQNGTVISNPGKSLPPLEYSMTFDGLPLDRYLSPAVYLPIYFSRGCYWGKCTFCTHHLPAGRFRTRNPESVFQDMKNLHEKHGCRHFYFIDDSLPPAVKNLAELISSSDLPLEWMGEIRMEKSFTSDFFRTLRTGGCRALLFGMESACKRTLERMGKGIEPETITRILKNARDSGITTWVFFMLGFPGERRHEAKKTIEFLAENRDHIDLVAGGSFILTRNSHVYNNPEIYKIKTPRQSPEKDLQLIFETHPQEGLKKPETEELLSKIKKDPDFRKYLHPFVTEPHTIWMSDFRFQMSDVRCQKSEVKTPFLDI